MTNWNVSYASVTGISHKQSKLPCQDSVHTCLSKDGQWIACVVSDGAGSAKNSQIASKLVTKNLSTKLISLSEQIDSNGWSYEYRKFIVNAIEDIREDLKKKAKSEDLRDYHCTLVATLVGKTDGLTIHIGDGAIFGGSIAASGENKISLSKNTFISLPKNGQYANETFFVTEKDWQNHLRIENIKNVDWFVSATDGGTALAMINDKEPKPGFIKPVIHQLTIDSSQKNRNNLLKSILSDIQANKLTSDDKTLAVIYRNSLLNKETEIDIDEALQKTNTYTPKPSALRQRGEEKRVFTAYNSIQTKVYEKEDEYTSLEIFLYTVFFIESLIVLCIVFAPEMLIPITNRIINIIDATSSLYVFKTN